MCRKPDQMTWLPFVLFLYYWLDKFFLPVGYAVGHKNFLGVDHAKIMDMRIGGFRVFGSRWSGWLGPDIGRTASVC
jgi:hypothetical protein